MTNSINDAIDAHAAHDLAEALASAGVSVSRSGWPNSDEECHIDGYGTVFFRETGWVVRSCLDDCEDRIDVTELANELAEIITMTKQIL